jgi:hypothetical protein
LSAIFQLLAKHLALDLPATLIFVPFAIASVRTMVIMLSITMPGVDAPRRNVLPLLRPLTMLRQNQNRTQYFSGVKWSELLCLPYFDPTRFVVIDAMHNLFLGLINEHFQNILGI